MSNVQVFSALVSEDLAMIGGGQEALVGLESPVAVNSNLVRASLEQRHCKDTLYFFTIIFILNAFYNLYFLYFI